MADTQGSVNDAIVLEIRSYMGEKGISQRQLGRTTGIHYTTLSDYLHLDPAKRVILTIPTVERIALGVGRDPRELIGAALVRAVPE